MTATSKSSWINNTSLFRILYIIDLFFCTVSFIQIPAYIFLAVLFIWGLRLVSVNQKRYNTFWNLRFGIWIGAFLAFSFASILINFSVTVFISILMFLHVLICFFIFYGMHTEPDFNFRDELFVVARFIIYATLVLNVIGFFCLMFGIHFDLDFFGYFWIRFPVYENRFTGPFFNPNMLGFIAVAAVFCCHVMYKDKMETETKYPRMNKILIAVSAVVNLFALILCDSNAAFVLMIGYVLVYLTYIFFEEREGLSVRGVLLRIVTLLVVSAVFVGSSLMFRSIFKTGFAAITTQTNALVDVLFHEDILDDIQDGSVQPEQPVTPSVTFDHENKNVDSGRIKLWKESIGLFRISPVFGISNGNIVFYSMEYLNGALQYNYNKSDLHNGFLTIIVSTGIIGALLFGTFGFRFAKHAAQHLFLRRKSVRNDVYPCLFAFLGAYMAYAFFEKALLYDISFIVMWFWLLMGYTSCFISKYEHMIETQYLFHRKRLRRTLL